jgi:hypothetical protein
MSIGPGEGTSQALPHLEFLKKKETKIKNWKYTKY